MKIRFKLLMLIAIMIFSSILAVFLTYLREVPVDNIEREQEILRDLETAILQEQVRLARFEQGVKWDLPKEGFLEAVSKVKDSFDSIKEFSFIPGLNENLSTAIKLVQGLQKLHDLELEKFIARMEKLEAAAVKAYGSTRNFDMELVYSDRETLERKGVYRSLFASVQILRGLIGDLDRVIEDTVKTVADQEAIIRGEIKQIRREGIFFLILVLALSSILALFFAAFIVRSITSSIKGMEKNISYMSKGDLTGHFTIKAKDELGILAGGLSVFQGNLNRALFKIKEVSGQNVTLKDNLIAMTNETLAAAEQMTQSILSIKQQIEKLDKSVETSSNEVLAVTGGIRNLDKQIDEQISMVEESSASVTQMISSVGSVSRLTGNNKAAVQRLVESAASGGNKLVETSEWIKDIGAAVEEINDMADAIKGVADQTNILAMNAAIEAAHAGASGKGFAVVADEIGKLAETAGVNSNDITKILAKVIKIINNANLSGEETSQAFTMIHKDIKVVSDSFEEINQSTVELNRGGQLILDAMTTLGQISSSVQESSGKMDESSKKVGALMEQLVNISGSVYNGIDEISIGIKDIGSAVAGVTEESVTAGELSDKLNREIEWFKTES